MHQKGNRNRRKTPPQTPFSCKTDYLNSDKKLRPIKTFRVLHGELYTIICVETDERDTGTRLDFEERYGIDTATFSNLKGGRQKTAKGYRLATAGLVLYAVDYRGERWDA